MSNEWEFEPWVKLGTEEEGSKLNKDVLYVLLACHMEWLTLRVIGLGHDL